MTRDDYLRSARYCLGKAASASEPSVKRLYTEAALTWQMAADGAGGARGLGLTGRATWIGRTSGLDQ